MTANTKRLSVTNIVSDMLKDYISNTRSTFVLLFFVFNNPTYWKCGYEPRLELNERSEMFVLMILTVDVN